MSDLVAKKKTIRNVIIFCIVVMTLAFISPLLGGSPSKPGPGFVIWGIAPFAVAIVIRMVTKDWSDSGFKPAIRKNASWNIISILAFPVMTVLTFFIGEMLSVSSFSGFSLGEFSKNFFIAIPVFFIFSIFEEIGWRGYLVPKLESIGSNSFVTSAIIAVIWSTWHLPYFRELSWVYSTEKLITFIPRFYLAMFAFAILYTEIRNITGSVWPAVVMHCVMNSFGHPLAADYIKIAPGKEYLVSSTGFLMIIFIGLMGVGLNRWRTRHSHVLSKDISIT